MSKKRTVNIIAYVYQKELKDFPIIILRYCRWQILLSQKVAFFLYSARPRQAIDLNGELIDSIKEWTQTEHDYTDKN